MSSNPPPAAEALLDPTRWPTDPETGITTITYSFADIPGRGFDEDIDPETNQPRYPDSRPLSRDQQSTARAAMNQWEAVSNIRFVEAPPGTVPQLTFQQLETEWGGFARHSGYAESPYPSDQPGKRFYAGADIAINQINQSGPALQTMLLHEIGHSLGLQHGGNYQATINGERKEVTSPPPYLEDLRIPDQKDASTMSYNPPVYGWEGDPTLGIADIEAIQWAYGANPKTGAGNSYYVFDGDGQGRQTIYDSGGTDQLDAGAMSAGFFNSSDGVYLNLDPSYAFPVHERGESSEGDTSEAVFIANQTLIEIGAGSQEADILNGNRAANLLMGRDEQDLLVGQDGDDALAGGRHDDVLVGNDGADRFIIEAEPAPFWFWEKASTDFIKDFAPEAGDRLQLSGFDGLTADELLNNAREVDGDTVLTLPSGQQVVLQSTLLAELTEAQIGLDYFDREAEIIHWPAALQFPVVSQNYLPLVSAPATPEPTIQPDEPIEMPAAARGR